MTLIFYIKNELFLVTLRLSHKVREQLTKLILKNVILNRVKFKIFIYIKDHKIVVIFCL